MAIFKASNAFLVVVMLVALASCHLISVQAASLGAQENAQNIASSFTTPNVDPGRTIANPETRKSTFFVGSVSQKVTGGLHQAVATAPTTIGKATTELKSTDLTSIGDNTNDLTPIGDNTKDITSLGEKTTDMTSRDESNKDMASMGENKKDITFIWKKAKDMAPIDESNKDMASMGENKEDITFIWKKAKDMAPIGEGNRDMTSKWKNTKDNTPIGKNTKDFIPIEENTAGSKDRTAMEKSWSTGEGGLHKMASPEKDSSDGFFGFMRELFSRLLG
jgi:hypothetical protein